METLIDSFNQIQYSNSEIFLQHNYSQANQQSINEVTIVATQASETSQNHKIEQEKDTKKQSYEVLLEQKQQEMVRQYLEEIRVLERQLWDMQNRQSNKSKVGVTENIFEKIQTMRIGNTSQTCSICYNGFEKDEIIKKLPCKHIFHLSCIKPWLKKQKTCPNCRDDICDSLKQQEQKKKSKRSSQNVCGNDLGEKLQKKETETKREQKSYDTPRNNELEGKPLRHVNKQSKFTEAASSAAEQN